MRVTIHQPQYLPWLLYFLKIQESDAFILLDTVSFQKNGLQNRNQIKTAQGAHWLTVPVMQQFGQKIIDVQINNDTNWRRKHWETIQQCYRKAQAFKTHADSLEDLYTREWAGLNELNIESMTLMLRWMNIRTPILRSSQMQAKGAASDLILNLCRRLEQHPICRVPEERITLDWMRLSKLALKLFIKPRFCLRVTRSCFLRLGSSIAFPLSISSSTVERDGEAICHRWLLTHENETPNSWSDRHPV